MQVNRDVYFAVREVSSRHLRFTNLHHAWLKLCRVERQMTSKEKKGGEHGAAAGGRKLTS